MTTISPIDARVSTANYNAVKIQVNDPKTSIPEGFKSSEENFGNYNAINIEVNRPTVEVQKDRTYDYPQAEGIVTYDQLVVPVFVPELSAPETAEEAEEQVAVEVPSPNVTTTEAEKKSLKSGLNFHGISFKANSPDKTDLARGVLPENNVKKVVENLNNKDYDVQALQMEDIAKTAATNPRKVLDFVNKEVFTSLINIIEKDTTNLESATQEQTDARKKIIVNELVKRQAEEEKLDPKTVELPYKLTEDEIKLAMKLTTMEQAERNKEYALYTIAMLSKAYVEENKAQTGNTVPLTDLPGMSTIVDALRHEKNPGVRVAAIDALVYSNRPEYSDEIRSILIMAANERNQMVAKTAASALLQMEEQKIQK